MGHKLIKFKLLFWKIDMYWVKIRPIKQQRSTNCKKLLQWNQVNTDTTGTMDNCLAISVRIIRRLSQAKTGQLVLLIAYTCHFCHVFSGKIFSQRECMLQKGSLRIKQGWRQCTSQSLYVTRIQKSVHGTVLLTYVQIVHYSILLFIQNISPILIG